MKKIKSKEELDKKVEYLREAFGKTLNASLWEIKDFMKSNFNPDIVHVGGKATFNLEPLFRMAPKWRKTFKNDPIQPITITYRRLDLIFFTYDKHPEMGEQYMDYDGGWSKYLYLAELKMSELWKKKEYLLAKDFNEYYLQVNTFEFTNPLTKYIKDIEFNFDKNE